MFREIHINLPLLDILQGIPKYSKYLKDVVNSKIKLQDLKTINFNKECSSVVMWKIPIKLKDPGNFTLPIYISDYDMVYSLSFWG